MKANPVDVGMHLFKFLGGLEIKDNVKDHIKMLEKITGSIPGCESMAWDDTDENWYYTYSYHGLWSIGPSVREFN